jgi:hypothetical protein
LKQLDDLFQTGSNGDRDKDDPNEQENLDTEAKDASGHRVTGKWTDRVHKFLPFVEGYLKVAWVLLYLPHPWTVKRQFYRTQAEFSTYKFNIPSFSRSQVLAAL